MSPACVGDDNGNAKSCDFISVASSTFEFLSAKRFLSLLADTDPTSVVGCVSRLPMLLTSTSFCRMGVAGLNGLT